MWSNKHINKLLEKRNVLNLIDFLSPDVEGAELDVLKGIDLKNYNFKLILIEAKDFNCIKNFYHNLIIFL